MRAVVLIMLVGANLIVYYNDEYTPLLSILFYSHEGLVGKRHLIATNH